MSLEYLKTYVEERIADGAIDAGDTEADEHTAALKKGLAEIETLQELDGKSDEVHYYQFYDGDYCPCFAAIGDRLLGKGDSDHNPYLQDYAEGFAKGRNCYYMYYPIETREDLETHSEALKKHGMYEKFEERVSQDEEWKAELDRRRTNK